MCDFEFDNVIPHFMTVGALRELLKNYLNETPISVCGTPGLFYLNNEQQYIMLESLDSGEYEDMPETALPSTVWQEYIDF